jgi:hypothetical protein
MGRRAPIRRKHDAGKTLEAFSTKPRDETDLDALSDDLTSVVRACRPQWRASVIVSRNPGPRMDR